MFFGHFGKSGTPKNHVFGPTFWPLFGVLGFWPFWEFDALFFTVLAILAILVILGFFEKRGVKKWPKFAILGQKTWKNMIFGHFGHFWTFLTVFLVIFSHFVATDPWKMTLFWTRFFNFEKTQKSGVMHVCLETFFHKMCNHWTRILEMDTFRFWGRGVKVLP